MRRAALAFAAAGLLALPLSARADDNEPSEAIEEAAEEVAEGAEQAEHATGEHHGGHHGAEPPHAINWTDWGKGKDVHGGELHPAEEGMPPGLLYALINFAVFLGLLVKLVGPKLAKALRVRHDLVKNQLAESAKLRQDARDKLEEYNRRIAGVDSEIAKLMAEIKADAEAEKQIILEQARVQAEAMKKDAERRIESEIARARQTLEREVVAASIAAAEKILRDRTTPDDQSRMFDGFVDTLLAGGKPPSGGSKVDKEWG
ncbi:MAG TPA: ATP synthase F0 subunit B [Kofleriaceae bacterium]|nr:ATP synthase F0 subunit B [Kofleriaceae bacterium]